MAADRKVAEEVRDQAWRGFKPGPCAVAVNVRDFIQRNYTPYEGDASFLAGRDEAHARCGTSCCRCLPRSARGACSPCRRSRRASSRTRPATSTRTSSSSSACRPTRRSSARSCRRAAGAWSRPVSRPTASSPTPRDQQDFHRVPQDAQRRRVRRLHAGDPQVPQLRRHHRPARRLRPRPHHRRLPTPGTVRPRLPDRGQAARTRRARRAAAPPRR